MAARTIYGQIGSYGDLMAGTGFQCSRVSAGVYSIDFTHDFTGTPSVTVTPIGYDNNINNIRYVFIKVPTSGQCIVYTFDTSSAPADAYFNFLAIGEE